MISVATFLQRVQGTLSLRCIAGKEGLAKPIKRPQVDRPGLALAGYCKGFNRYQFLVFGKEELSYLAELPIDVQIERLQAVLVPTIAAVCIAKKQVPLPHIVSLCNERHIPLCRSPLDTPRLVNALGTYLQEMFMPSTLCHGTLVEVFGLGVFIQGTSSVGKSETALGLIERKHRLVADDVVRVMKKDENTLMGTGMELGQHIMEIRGIGIINVAHLFGSVSVRKEHKIDLVVYLEAWDDTHSYERVGLEEKSCDILGCSIPFYLLPVKPGRDVVLLLETIVLNHRLKTMGIHSAKEFSMRLTTEIDKGSKK